MEIDDAERGLVLAGGHRLDAPLRALGLLDDDGRRGLVYDASDSIPATWDDVATELDEVFRRTQQAAREGEPIVYVVHEPSVWGHESPLRSGLATALLGGMRSAAVELARYGVAANAVALADDAEVQRAARSVAFLLDSDLTGQTITCGSTHLGRPPV